MYPAKTTGNFSLLSTLEGHTHVSCLIHGLTGGSRCSNVSPSWWTDNSLSLQFPSGWYIGLSYQWQLYVHHAFPTCLQQPCRCAEVSQASSTSASSNYFWSIQGRNGHVINNLASYVFPHFSWPPWSHSKDICTHFIRRHMIHLGQRISLAVSKWSSCHLILRFFATCISVFLHSNFVWQPSYTFSQWIKKKIHSYLTNYIFAYLLWLL